METGITAETLTALAGRLSPDEREVYLWLRESFSPRWIAETTLRELPQVKSLAVKVYRALKVKSQAELVAYYGVLDKTAGGGKTDVQPAEVARAIDRYNRQTIDNAAAGNLAIEEKITLLPPAAKTWLSDCRDRILTEAAANAPCPARNSGKG